jgi:hypothetical protein
VKNAWAGFLVTSVMLTSGCFSPGGSAPVQRGTEVEVTFNSHDVTVQGHVAARCGLTESWRLSATRVRYQSGDRSGKALECLRLSPGVGSAVVPL